MSQQHFEGPTETDNRRKEWVRPVLQRLATNEAKGGGNPGNDGQGGGGGSHTEHS
jgi:hypothetical protein